MGIHNNAVVGASGQQGYQISRSVRLRRSATGYFTRVAGTPTSQNVWTLSMWVKLGTMTNGCFFGANQAGNPNESIKWTGPEEGGASQIYYQSATAGGTHNLTRVIVNNFRDPSAWYHLVFQKNASAAAGTGCFLAWVNGVAVTFTGGYTGTQASVPNYINTTGSTFNIGAIGSANSLDCYMTEVNFVDGQALTPSSFGETNSITGVWQPKKYTGTYGNNGFYVNFSDNSAATAAAIGKDYSGNGNNLTPNNISVTAGATYDSMLDTPTRYADGGNGRGNYAVMSPLFTAGQAETSITRSQGNLVITSGNTGNWAGTGSTISFGMTSSFYAEVQLFTGTFQGHAFGVVKTSDHVALNQRTSASPYSGICINHQGAVYRNGTNIANVAATTNGDVISIAFDGPNSQVIFKKNNATWYTVTSVPVEEYVFYGYISDASYQIWNFGQRPFNYSVPTGFNALNTQNLPATTITKGNQYFDVLTYTGATGDQTVSGLQFAPDLIWGKSRTGSNNHHIQSPLLTWTGSTAWMGFLETNTTAIEQNTGGGDYQNITSTGYSVIGDNGRTGANGTTYVSWNWNGGGSTVTNTSGSISSQVRANPTAGFSVVKYTGTGANATVGHGLGVAPKMLIVKNLSAVSSWLIWHTAFAGTEYILFDTSAKTSLAAMWNSTVPTSTVFNIGTNANTNGSTNKFIAYCWAEVAGYSKIGTYTGTGNADGPFVYTGFRPKFVIVRAFSTGLRDWLMYDTSTSNPYNIGSDGPLIANSTDVTSYDSSSYQSFDILSNGFKPRASTTNMNASGETHLYMAFAENPFKNSLAR